MLLGLGVLLSGLAGVAGEGRPAQWTAIEQRVFLMVNEVRHRDGLPDLKWDERVAEEARRHSARMAVYWFFSHTDPERGNLRRRLAADHIRWRECAENISSENGYADPAAEAVKGWLGSPPHRQTMLRGSLTVTGIGVAKRVDGTILITQDFIRP